MTHTSDYFDKILKLATKMLQDLSSPRPACPHVPARTPLYLSTPGHHTSLSSPPPSRRRCLPRLAASTARSLPQDGIAFIDPSPKEEQQALRLQRKPSPHRDAAVEENLRLWAEMQAGSDEGVMCCMRAKIDPASDNGVAASRRREAGRPRGGLSSRARARE